MNDEKVVLVLNKSQAALLTWALEGAMLLTRSVALDPTMQDELGENGKDPEVMFLALATVKATIEAAMEPAENPA